jgi:hypothetical protein
MSIYEDGTPEVITELSSCSDRKDCQGTGCRVEKSGQSEELTTCLYHRYSYSNISCRYN